MENVPQTVELDVRPHLRKKLEPFLIIMDTVKSLNKKDTFILHATFKPTPLLGLMKTKGFIYKLDQVEPDHWIVTFKHKSRKHEKDSVPVPTSDNNESASSIERTAQTYELDNRGLEPPQPMIRTLKKLEEAQSGIRLLFTTIGFPCF